MTNFINKKKKAQRSQAICPKPSCKPKIKIKVQIYPNLMCLTNVIYYLRTKFIELLGLI